MLLDELGAGTDPAEGSALARAILNTLRERHVTTMVTTHHPELKVYSVETPGVRNASVEFDLNTLAPTYRLIIGLPGRSNALAIAQRLGLNHDIIEDARSMVATEELVADDLLDEIHRTREDIRRQQDVISLMREELESAARRTASQAERQSRTSGATSSPRRGATCRARWKNSGANCAACATTCATPRCRWKICAPIQQTAENVDKALQAAGRERRQDAG